MTDREKAIVMAYTGVTMLSGEKFQIFHEYIEKILGRPVWTHELAVELVWNEIKEKSKDDFLEICKTEERSTWHWCKTGQSFVNPNKFRNYCCSNCLSELDEHIRAEPNFCPNCGADMRGEKNDK